MHTLRIFEASTFSISWYIFLMCISTETYTCVHNMNIYTYIKNQRGQHIWQFVVHFPVCMNIHTYVWVWIHTYMYICIRIHMSGYGHTYRCTWIWIRIKNINMHTYLRNLRGQHIQYSALHFPHSVFRATFSTFSIPRYIFHIHTHEDMYTCINNMNMYTHFRNLRG